MMKFFRKYNKHLLAVFMVLLMVVFIGGTALEGMLTPNINSVVATSRLGSIGTTDRQHALAITDILGRMGQNWQAIGGFGAKPIETVDWILLSREASSLGVEPDPSAIRAALSASGVLGDYGKMARAMRQKLDVLILALAEVRAIQEVGNTMASSGIPGAAEVRTLARDILDRVTVNTVILPASAFDDDTEFTGAELDAQWQAFKDAKPGGKMEFGYYVSPRIAVQYIRVDRDKVAELIGVPNLEKKAHRYYDDNRQTEPAFRRPENNDVADDGPEQSPYLSWEEAKGAAEKIIRTQFADEAAVRMADWLVQYAGEPWLDYVRGDDGYRPMPPGTDDPDYYAGIVARMPKTIAVPEAIAVNTTELVNADEVRELPEIGSAVFRPARGASLDFGRLAFRTKAVVDQVPDSDGINPADFLAPFQTCSYPITAATGNLFLFRVVDSRPGHPSDSLDEVRDRVVADLRLLRGFEAAKAKGEGMRSNAEDVGLKEAFDTDDDLIERLGNSPGAGWGFAKSSPTGRLLEYQASSSGRTETAYVGGGVGSVPSSVVDGWFDLEFAEPQIGVYELKDRAAILVAEWVETSYGRWDEFEDLQKRLVPRLIRQRRSASLRDWFDPENIRDRNEFELATR